MQSFIILLILVIHGNKAFLENEGESTTTIIPTPQDKYELCTEDEETSGQICIRKCCEPTEVFRHIESGYVKCTKNYSEEVWTPILLREGDATPFPRFKFISSHTRESWCPDGPFILDTEEYEGTKYLFRVDPEGNVIVKNHPLLNWQKLTPGAFCIDGILRSPESNTFSPQDDLIILDCAPILNENEELHEDDEVNKDLYLVFSGIACFFLFLTVLVYLILWERQNIHSWTLLGYACTMLLLHTSVFAIHIHNVYNRRDLDEGEEEGEIWCRGLAITQHFLYLSAFCWLTLINFDVWWTFSKITRRITIGRYTWRKRFLAYVVFATVFPALIIGLGLTLRAFYRDKLDSSVPFIEYESIFCDIFDYSALFFKFLPVALVMGCNLFLFLFTMVAIHKIGESTKFATNRSSQNDQEKSKFLLFIKLFFVMGLVWILEIISYFAFGRASSHIVAYITDVIVILQPIAVFGIFVCKADIMRGLQVKMPCLHSVFDALGLDSLRSRAGSGLSTASVATQVSNLSTRNGKPMTIGGGNSIVCLEMVEESQDNKEF